MTKPSGVEECLTVETFFRNFITTEEYKIFSLLDLQTNKIVELSPEDSENKLEKGHRYVFIKKIPKEPTPCAIPPPTPLHGQGPSRRTN